MLKMLKIGCFKQNYCILGMPQGTPMQFFLNNCESQVTVISFTQIHSGLLLILLFQKFQSWKMLKMLKISCFELF